ncbi:MAG: T9SS type A sorting domain-containing protein [Candidatus Nomurabacteria bacterium]|nr:T9SS type A sorting domain-containing protein [Candidatus Nomurabacteria bacterium]
MKKISLLLVVFAVISWSTKMNAQTSWHFTGFSINTDTTFVNSGGWFMDADSLKFIDHSYCTNGQIVLWRWKFQGADNNDTLAQYTSYVHDITRKWSNPGYYRVELGTLDSFGQWNILNVGVHIAFSIATGISENSEVAFSLYPNPANENITIDLPLNGRESNVEIIDVTGRLILSLKVSGKQNIDVSSFKDGVYFLKNGNTTKKFIVAH